MSAAAISMPTPAPSTREAPLPSEARVAALVARDHETACAHTDRQFALLFGVQWVFGAVIALYVSPFTWSGDVATVSPHVWAALGLGALVSALPAYFALAAPGKPLTRHVIAFGQMGIGILLIHLTGGRIETHFHVFGSLAFLAAYRDRSVLTTATAVVIVDHLLRTVFWPYSVFGVASASLWRPLEHAGWVVFEDVVLFANCARANATARLAAARQIALEEVNSTVEARVERRTAELQESRHTLERVNEELRTATTLALESSRLKSEFLATVSHEIRTPMNGIIGVAELLRDTPLVPDQIEYVDIIDRSSHSLLGIINDILDFSKLEAGKLEVESLELDLAAQIDHVLTVLGRRASEKRLALGAVVAPGVPRFIMSDAGRLNQVLLNLVGNGIKFTEQGHVALRVSRVGDASMPILRFDVEDTGPGIDSAMVDRLFEPFTQADASTTRRFGGTGLGLAISRRLAEALGGTLSIQKTLGAGTTFRFDVPLRPARGTLEIEPLSPSPAGRAVVLALDESGGRLVQQQLAAWGVQVDLTTILPRSLLPDQGLIVGYDLDSASMAGLRALAGAHPTVFLRAPFTPVRFWRELATRSLEPARAPATHTQQASAPRGGDHPYALVVEDNNVNQVIAVRMLAKLGYRTDTAENGAEATRRTERQRYDVILMDCQMPEMDGYEATRRIRGREAALSRTPIIAVTANAMSDDRERCLAVGMDDFVSKPLTLAALRGALARSLRPPAEAGDAAHEQDHPAR